MKTMSMGGVSKNVMGLVLSIRIMEEASTAQLNNSKYSTAQLTQQQGITSTALLNHTKT
jgi:hypothetical protein